MVTSFDLHIQTRLLHFFVVQTIQTLHKQGMIVDDEQEQKWTRMDDEQEW